MTVENRVERITYRKLTAQTGRVPRGDRRATVGGGNNIKESGPGPAGTTCTAFDGCIIERKIGDNAREIAHDLLEEVTDAELAAWTSTPVMAWANESLEITRRATVGYCVQVGNKCIYEVGNEEFKSGEHAKTVTVNDVYLETHAAIVADRLKRAGVRLGHLLNTSLGR